jgi:hypothetical protein
LDAERSVGRYCEALGRVVSDRYLVVTFYPDLTRQGRRHVFRRGTLSASAVFINTFEEVLDEGTTLDMYEAELVRVVPLLELLARAPGADGSEAGTSELR